LCRGICEGGDDRRRELAWRATGVCGCGAQLLAELAAAADDCGAPEGADEADDGGEDAGILFRGCGDFD
jgi:hypothetical protein